VVADAGKRSERLRRVSVQERFGMAEGLGQPPAGLEVKLGILQFGDLAVYLLDAGLELVRLDK
jgi:hypothetical protein